MDTKHSPIKQPKWGILGNNGRREDVLVLGWNSSNPQKCSIGSTPTSILMGLKESLSYVQRSQDVKN